MSSISIRWERRAVKELATLPRRDQQRVVDAVGELSGDPLQGKALSGRWKGFRRLRVGRHRVIYAFDGRKLIIFVVRVGQRQHLYR